MDGPPASPTGVPDAAAPDPAPRSFLRPLAIALGAAVVVALGIAGYRASRSEPIGLLCSGGMVRSTTPAAASPEQAVKAFLAEVGWQRDRYERESETEWRHYDGPLSYRRIEVRYAADGWAVGDTAHCSPVPS